MDNSVPQPNTPLSEVRGIGDKFQDKLKNLGLETVRDLLYHFPTRYEDFSEVVPIAEVEKGGETTVQGEITDINTRKSWKKKFTITTAVISDDSDSIEAVWFNQPYLRRTLKPGAKVNISGEVKTHKGKLQFSNPIYEVLRDDNKVPIHTARILPKYPETKGLTSRGIRYLVEPLLEKVKMDDPIPEKVREKERLPEINEALKNIHFPADKGEIQDAQRRFSFEDLFVMQIYNEKQKQDLSKHPAESIEKDVEFIKEKLARLPFDLTDAQRKALWAVLEDLERDQPMNRLLQGDVGSGKTIVAIMAALLVAEQGHQTAFMAPTEILARQHYETLKEFFPEMEGGTALLTGSESREFLGEGLEAEAKKQDLLEKIKNNKIKLVVGTHALIQKQVEFGDLAFVVVDEQHRFGVDQRAELARGPAQTKRGQTQKESGSSLSKLPHFLSMSATPIPRTLSLTVFGDLDLSVIDELPKGRQPVKTRVIPPKKRRGAYKFIKDQVKEGRQAFVICPRIEASEPDEDASPREKMWQGVKAVKEEHEKLAQEIFPDLEVGMLHGRLSSDEKQEVMEKFAEGDVDILVSTSVVEVGIDIPNATIMMVEGAGRFGLAQLYQFRGRVGRGEHQSYCLLFTDSKSRSTRKRLRSIEEAKSGLELAEKDLQIRGPGEFLGTTQSGMPDLAMKALQNPDMVKKTKKYAHAVAKKDPGLEKLPALRRELSKFEEKVHRE